MKWLFLTAGCWISAAMFVFMIIQDEFMNDFAFIVYSVFAILFIFIGYFCLSIWVSQEKTRKLIKAQRKIRDIVSKN